MATPPHSLARVAAIDIGTNSILLTIAEGLPDGVPKILLDRATVTRLGAGVDASRRLSEEAIHRSLDCLQSYAHELEAHDVSVVDVVGTSALRDSSAVGSFLDRAQAILGVRPRVIGGLEEAALTCRGALSGLAVEGPFVLFDVGGGSTEIVVGECYEDGITIAHSLSLDLGCVRLTERFLTGDPPTAESLALASSAVESALRAIDFDTSRGTLIGTAGTVTTLAALDLELVSYDAARVHGSQLSRGTLQERFQTLAAQNHAERLKYPTLTPGRADVIVSGALIVLKLMEFLARDEIRVSDRGVRYGLLERLLSDSHLVRR